MTNNNLAISEIYKSFQGEGLFLGSPAIFLRLSGCNLRCKWCDSKYSWEKEKTLDIDSILRTIVSYDLPHLVITGGEPLLQQNTLYNLLDLIPNNYVIEVETNGTIMPNNDLFSVVTIFNVSPKLLSSGEKLKINLDVLDCLNYHNAIFKFVITDDSDFFEAEQLIDKLEIDIGRVFLMPQGFDEKQLIENSKWLLEKCIEKGYQFTPRLHIMLYGCRRGI